MSISMPSRCMIDQLRQEALELKQHAMISQYKADNTDDPELKKFFKAISEHNTALAVNAESYAAYLEKEND